LVDLKERELLNLKKEGWERKDQLLKTKHALRILDQSENEVIIGIDTEHITLRISLLLKRPRKHAVQTNLFFSTRITFYNRPRWFYLPLTYLSKHFALVMVRKLVVSLEKEQISQQSIPAIRACAF
jgi:hypothetical protein